MGAQDLCSGLRAGPSRRVVPAGLLVMSGAMKQPRQAHATPFYNFIFSRYRTIPSDPLNFNWIHPRRCVGMLVRAWVNEQTSMYISAYTAASPPGPVPSNPAAHLADGFHLSCAASAIFFSPCIVLSEHFYRPHSILRCRGMLCGSLSVSAAICRPKRTRTQSPLPISHS